MTCDSGGWVTTNPQHAQAWRYPASPEAEGIWASITASPAEHLYEVETERMTLEVGKRAGAELALEDDLKGWMVLIRLGACHRKGTDRG